MPHAEGGSKRCFLPLRQEEGEDPWLFRFGGDIQLFYRTRLVDSRREAAVQTERETELHHAFAMRGY